MSFFPLSGRHIVGLTLTAALLVAGPAWAQDEDPGSTGPQPGGPATGVPIDGGASLLLAGGVAYGLKRLRQRRPH